MALVYEEKSLVVSATKDRENGDWSTNALFSLAKVNNVNIDDLGSTMLGKINRDLSSYIEIQKVEIKNKGFINFY